MSFSPRKIQFSHRPLMIHPAAQLQRPNNSAHPRQLSPPENKILTTFLQPGDNPVTIRPLHGSSISPERISNASFPPNSQ
jgi:hypothetical protein